MDLAIEDAENPDSTLLENRKNDDAQVKEVNESTQALVENPTMETTTL